MWLDLGQEQVIIHKRFQINWGKKKEKIEKRVVN